MLRRTREIAVIETRLMWADPFPLVLMIAMPIVLLAFLSKGIVGGPGQSVAGLAALFGFFGVTVVGFAFLRDHGWNTWDRLRVSASPAEVMIGKAAPIVALFVLQDVVMLGLGRLVFDMPWHGSLLAAAALVLSVALIEVAFGLALVAVCSSANQVNAVGTLGALLLAGAAGSLTPFALLPHWVRAIAPADPAYWAVRGFRSVILGTSASAASSILALIGFAAAAFAITLWRYRFDEAKTWFE